MKTIGQKLLTLRGEQDIEIVAKAIGVTKQAIWNYENDKRIPRDDIKRKLADYYKTSVGNIFLIKIATKCCVGEAIRKEEIMGDILISFLVSLAVSLFISIRFNATREKEHQEFLIEVKNITLDVLKEYFRDKRL